MEDSESMTIFTFGKNLHHQEVNFDEEIVEVNPDLEETNESLRVMCILFKTGKLGTAYYDVDEKMVSLFL